MGGMNYHRNSQPHPARLPIGDVYKIKLEAWPWESESPAQGASANRGPAKASPEQRQRLQTLGVMEDDQLMTRVQASFILNALQPLEAYGINIQLVAGTDHITDPQARRRFLCRCRSAINEGARQASQVMATAKSSDRDVARAKAVVATAFSTLRKMIDGRLAALAPHATA